MVCECGSKMIRWMPPNGGNSWFCTICLKGSNMYTCKCVGCKIASCGPQIMDRDTWDRYLHCSKCHTRVNETYTDQQLCLKCHMEAQMAKQQKKAVTVGRKTPSYGYKNQWYVSGSAATPYTVSEANDGNWSCSCPAWTRNHPREDCKHVMRVKLAEAVPAEVKVEPSMVATVSTGRMFR
jgi:hypothetical protein